MDRLEKILAKRLFAFYNSNIAGSILPMGVIKQNYDVQIQSIIRKAIQDSYFEGTDIVNNAITNKNPDFQLFVSGTDISNIQQSSIRLTNQFWETASRLKMRESEVVPITETRGLPPDTIEPKKKKGFATQAALSGVASLVVYNAFNTAVRSKTAQTVPSIAAIPPPVPEATIGAPETPDITLDIPYVVAEIRGGVPLKGRVRFTTRHDAKVDPQICAPLDGMEWDVGDPDIVVPWEDTHKYCRCRLIPIVEGETGEEE